MFCLCLEWCIFSTRFFAASWWIQSRQSFWFGNPKRKTRMPWFNKFEWNHLLNHDFVFHCAACNVLLVFGPSVRSMSPVCKMSLLWITVMVTVPSMSLPTTTLMRCFMFRTTFMPLGVCYGKRPMTSLIPCSKITPTLLTLLARYFSCGRVTICWQLGGGT